ncbi:MAG TPA: nuclear transport factor 2 family protein [Acidimicrobiia bacterium]|nr:nuclear transport factor 2 family protein [Acidimicrobiia bacterium]
MPDAAPSPALDPDRARRFVDEWIAAWNRHDLEAICGMLADDVEFVSPFLGPMYDTPSGVLRGRDAVRGWFAKSLQDPDFHIDDPINVLVGIDTVVLVESINGIVAANVFTLDADHRITKSQVHA